MREQVGRSNTETPESVMGRMKHFILNLTSFGAFQRLSLLETHFEERLRDLEEEATERFRDLEKKIGQLEKGAEGEIRELEVMFEEHLADGHTHIADPEPVPPGEDATKGEIKRYQEEVLRQANTPSPPGERAKIGVR